MTTSPLGWLPRSQTWKAEMPVRPEERNVEEEG
jgi:hypothetical protein